MSESSSSSGFTYRAFISYSHRDKAWGDWLHRALETYRVPSRLVGRQTATGTIPRRLNPVFRDREELSSSPELGSKINEALAKSENLIVICSPASAASRWVNEEVLTWKRMGRGDRVFCLIVGGEPNASGLPGRETGECFCPALRFKLDADGQPTNEPTEPIAADARQGKDGKANAKLKLIAGMLGVGFDTLKQREQHRRMRRMFIITSAALVVMAATIVLAVFALISRHEAVIAQHKAQVAQQSAERRQKQAEDLVDFMLGDLTTKLRQVDRLDILDAVDDKAMAYFKSLPPTDVSATELAQRAKALQKIGEVRMNNSRLADAMEAFQQALRLNRQLVARAPHDPLYQNSFAENLLWVGFVDWHEGKLDLAETAFKQSASALERAAALAPSNKDVQHNLDNIYNNVGHVAQARGELEVAARDYAKDLALCQRMVVEHPNDVIWRNALGDAHGNLAAIALTRGHIDKAISGYLKQQHILSDVVSKQPDNRQMQEQLLESDAIVGRTLALTGQTRAAIAYVEAALKIGKAQTAFDPNHQGWQDAYATIQSLAAQLSREHGDTTTAANLAAASVKTLQKLVHADPGNSSWRSDLASAKLEGARIAMARQQPKTAGTLAGEADAAVRKLLASNAPKAELIRLAANTELLLARLAPLRGGAVVAGNYRRQALKRMQAAAVIPSDPRNLSLLAEALLANGATDQAKAALKRLQATGYGNAGFVARLHADGIQYSPDPAAVQRIAKAMVPAPIGSKMARAGDR